MHFRIKTELLCQISQITSQSNFFLICATNCPWDLDSAFLRRFQKRVYVPLPDYAERRDLFKMFTKNTALDTTSTIWENLINRTDGWSGSDISDLVQQVCKNTPKAVDYFTKKNFLTFLATCISLLIR